MSRKVSVTWGKDSPRRHGERREVGGMEEAEEQILRSARDDKALVLAMTEK